MQRQWKVRREVTECAEAQRRWDRAYQYLLQWGSRGSEAGQFNEPLDIVLDGQGNIYVSDQFNNRVQKFRDN